LTRITIGIEHNKNINHHGDPLADPSILAELRAEIRCLAGGGAGFSAPVATLGDPLIDATLPWGGLPLGTLHEVRGGLASGFTAALAGRFLRHPGALVWCADATLARRSGRLYGPGLARFGIDTTRLILVHGRGQREVLWAAHEALRSAAVTAVVMELEALDLLAGRRLQLAAEAGGTAGLLLRFGRADSGPSAAVTRWRADPFLLDPGSNDRRCWSLDLWRVKGGVPGHWLVRYDDQTLSVAALDQPRDRPAAVASAPASQGAA
jgi:protein ImuA